MIVALTTDFGAGSIYVAQMKGVLLSTSRALTIVDVTHELPPYDVRAAEVFLRGVAYAFPIGTVHVVVVDPGVGGARRPIAVRLRGSTYVGPDNGVLGQLAADPAARCVVLDRPALFREPVAPTFHGRDIFAPVAAELASGLDLDAVGTPITDPAPSTLPRPQLRGDAMHGETLAADRFGNLTTNLPWSAARERLRVRAGGQAARLVRTYADAPTGELLALCGSDGYLELALREGSAAEHLGGAAGLEVVCERT